MPDSNSAGHKPGCKYNGEVATAVSPLNGLSSGNWLLEEVGETKLSFYLITMEECPNAVFSPSDDSWKEHPSMLLLRSRG